MPRTSPTRRINTGRELDLGEQIRRAIETSGHSASEVARMAEIDPAQVHRFLSGERDLRLQTAGFVCRALGLHLAEASRGRGRPKMAPQMTKTDRVGMSVEPGITGVEGSD